MDVSLFNEFMLYPVVVVTEIGNQKVLSLKPVKKTDKNKFMWYDSIFFQKKSENL